MSGVCICSSRQRVPGKEHVERSIGEASEQPGLVVRGWFVGHLLRNEAAQHNGEQPRRLGGSGIRVEHPRLHGRGEGGGQLIHQPHAGREGCRRGLEPRHRAPVKELRQGWILDRPAHESPGRRPDGHHPAGPCLDGSLHGRAAAFHAPGEQRVIDRMQRREVLVQRRLAHPKPACDLRHRQAADAGLPHDHHGGVERFLDRLLAPHGTAVCAHRRAIGYSHS